MQCLKPIYLKPKHQILPQTKDKMFPCGKCIACRMAKTREWSLRMMHELQYHEDNVFITLTYDEDHVPENMSLKKEHFVNFMKRLRRKTPKKIKYFACGEYGDETFRPHYHAIIFGLGLNKPDKNLIMKNWPFCDWNQYSIRRNSFGLAEYKSIKYVAGYINKKLSGPLAEEEYTKYGVEPVFRLLSQGIGQKYCDEHSEILTEKQSIRHRGLDLSLPRYYVKRLGLTNDLSKEKSEQKDCELTERYTGIYIKADDLYKTNEHENMRSYVSKFKKMQDQAEKNLIAKVSMKQSKKL